MIRDASQRKNSVKFQKMTSNENKLPETKFGLGSDNSDLIILVLKYFHIVALVFFVWLIGYFGFSIAWILIASFAYLWRERTSNLRKIKSDMIRAVHLDEKNAILARLDEVPSWVHFPDKERAEWINKILKQVWPYFIKYLDSMFKTTIEPIIKASVPAVVGDIRFEKIDFGDLAPRIGSIKVYTEQVLENEIIIDLEVLYAGDAKIKMQMKKLIVGVKSIQFQGDMRIILKPLCTQIPFFAALTAFFLRTPSFDFDLTEVANALDIPILNDTLKTVISDILNKILVLPNRLVIPIVPDFLNEFELNSLRAPEPKGVLRLYVYRAYNLVRADINMFGQGKSDPYVKIHGCGNHKFKTKVIQNNLNPEWNEVFHLTLESLEGNLKLILDVYDEDINNDDFIGGLSIDLQQIIAKGSEEGTYNLKNVKHGQIKLRFDWFYLTDDIAALELSKNFSRDTFNVALPVSILIVHLKHANDLPTIVKKSGGITEPNPFAIFSIGNKTFTSNIQINTTNPHWDENFYFMVENPQHEVLNIKINDKKTEAKLTSMDFNISELLVEDNLSIDRKFNLNCPSSYSATLTMAISLKIFTQNDPHSLYEEENISEKNLNEETQKSQKTSPDVSITDASEKNNITKAIPNIMLNNGIESKQSPVSQLSVSSDNTDSLRKRHNLPAPSSPSLSFKKDQGYGKINLTFQYKLRENVFSVRIHSCKSLKPVHQKNLPDPYVRLYLLPDLKSKQRTRSIHDNLDPEYEHTCEWNISLNDLKKRTLQISIKNEKPFLSHEIVYMGELSFELSKLEANQVISGWFDIREKNESKFITDRI